MHQRSPVWSHPRITSKVHGQNTPNCSSNSQLEAGQGDAVHSSTSTHLSGLGPNSASSLEVPAIKATSLNHGFGQENCPTTACVEAITSKYESTSMKSTSMSDQKTLKVRIKVGTDNLPAQKNAAIYSGLGLDVSPSSSLDDSPSEGEGISHGRKDAPFESPSSILQIMTSLPMLLSPLSDDLIHSIGEETDSKEGIPDDAHMEESESSGMLLNESITVRGNRKLLGGKKIKSVEGCGSLLEFKGGINKNGVLSRKEQRNDALTTDELVSKALKLPLLSSSFCDDSVKGVDELCDKLKEAGESVLREKIFSDHAQMEQAKPKSTEVNGFIEKAKAGSGRKAVADKVDRGKTCDSVTVESRARTALNYEHTEPPENAFQISERDGMTLPVVREPPIPTGKKSKVGHGTMASEGEKQNLRVSNLLPPKTKKSSDDGATSKNENKGVRVQKDHGKARDAYRDFFGEFEEEEDRLDALETPCVDKLKDSEVFKRKTSASISGATERSGANKVVKPLSSDVYPRTAANLVRCSANRHGSDVDKRKEAPVTATPVVFEDNWVQCDRCQKWRLLPAGTNPDHLPEKWLCSMLDWLPDKNRCSVSEDETTKALIALYHGPTPEGQSNPQNAFGSVVGGTLSNSQHFDQHWLDHSLHALPDGKEKIAKEMSNAAAKDGSFPLLSSVKKGLHSSVKSKNLNDVNKSPAVNALNVPVEKHRTKQKILEDNSDIGETKNLKVKSKRDPNQNCPRSFKKSKTDGVFSTDEDWIPDHGRTARKVGHGVNRINTTSSCERDQSKHKDSSSSRDSKYNGKDRLQVSIEKKRKIREYQDTQTCSTGNHVQEGRVSVQDGLVASRKEKKARVSKSEGRESSTSKGSGRADKKMSQAKSQKFRQDPGSTLSQRSLDGMDCLKGDLDSVQATAAAISSSSKVSGSHKSKAGFQEVKGSPVESVSSSPMRLLNSDKFINKGEDDSLDAGATGSPRRCSDGEDDGGSDRTGTARKNKSLTVIHSRSLGSSKLDLQDKDVNHTSGTKFNAQTLSPDIVTSHFTNCDVDTVGLSGSYTEREQIKDQCQSEDRTGVYGASMSLPRKTGRGSCLKDNNESCKSEPKGENVKNTSSLGQSQELSPLSEANHGDNKTKFQAKLGLKSDEGEDMHTGKKDCTGDYSRRKENQLNRGKEFQEVSVDTIKQEALLSHSQNQSLAFDAERSSKRSMSERTDQEILEKEKSLSMPPLGGPQIETVAYCPQPSAGFHKGSGDLVVDPSKVDDAAKLQNKQIRKADNQNGTQHFGSKHPTLNGHRSKELGAPSPTRRDSSSHAANNALKEAKDLKHWADRVKNSGSTESTGLYFEAALKFLHGASLLESGNNDNNAKHNEMIQSKQVYSSTAKLCEFCAHEYEKLKDMAAAALAYKCMEVAYMRVVYSSHYSASRDRQTASQIVPIGESPSSSASDIDNVNNSATAEKFALPKGVSSPQVSGTLVIPAQKHSSIMRLLDFVQDVNLAMEASRKSQIAFAAADSSLSGEKHADGISSVKKALDFNFHDVEGLLRLVRLATETISR
ncbi:cysteine-tryptophan domain-containing zinc finger protein 3-like isoform X3 [Prosopis cineraria]|nr:cysteine-tryptophan domain-containing zinc finger protein 3-like isoform X3 [Prosopis cineraria]